VWEAGRGGGRGVGEGGGGANVPGWGWVLGAGGEEMGAVGWEGSGEVWCKFCRKLSLSVCIVLASDSRLGEEFLLEGGRPGGLVRGRLIGVRSGGVGLTDRTDGGGGLAAAVTRSESEAVAGRWGEHVQARTAADR